tara:strand:+ start:1518 stop:2324 length:807 start_codon:yes stop_codon:yes gene_type:complete
MSRAGFKYEEDLIKKLLSFGLIPEGFEQPAGSDDSQPDITIRNVKGDIAGVEVKLEENAAFGSGTLQFDVTAHLVTKKDPWYIAEVDQYGNEIKESQDLIAKMAKQVDLVKKVNQGWYTKNKKYVPYQIDQGTKLYKKYNVALPSKMDMFLSDQKNLPDIFVPCPATNIIDYYTKKDCHYIQIGNKGLYWFGKKDPLKISGKMAKFSPSESRFRVRFQPKGSRGGSYRFAFELYCKGLTPSPVTLGKNLGTGGSYRGIADSDLSFLRT